MATHYATLKNGVYLQKHYYLSSTHPRILHIPQFYVVVRDENYLISLSMNIPDNFRNERQIVEKNKVVPTKLPISKLLLSVSKLVPNQCLVIVLFS